MARKILIVDDDPRNIFALSATLKAAGYVCETAPSAAPVLRMLEHSETGIGIILLDMMMPDMDGYTAIPQFKSRHNIPIIAVTAQAMAGDHERCLAAGADAYVSKPVDVPRLLALLQQYLG